MPPLLSQPSVQMLAAQHAHAALLQAPFAAVPPVVYGPPMAVPSVQGLAPLPPLPAAAAMPPVMDSLAATLLRVGDSPGAGGSPASSGVPSPGSQVQQGSPFVAPSPLCVCTDQKKVSLQELLSLTVAESERYEEADTMVGLVPPSTLPKKE